MRNNGNIQLLYWEPGIHLKKSFGHVALKVTDAGFKGNNIYVSYWPKPGLKFFQSSEGIHSTENEDRIRYQNSPKPKEIEINNLDAEKIVQQYLKFKHSGGNWFIFSECMPECFSSTKYYNCSFLITHLLIAGGINDQLPSYDKFGSLKHLLLLSASRVFIGTSTLVYGLYPIIKNAIVGSTSQDMSLDTSFMGAIVIAVINGISVFFLEKHFDPRELVEMSNSDCIVGVSASLGFGFYPLVHRKWITPQLLQKKFPLWLTILIDLTVIPGTIVGLLVFGSLTSYLIYCFGGTGYINHPSNLFRWVEYAKNTRTVDKSIKSVIFKKEFSFITIIYITALTCYAATKLGFAEEPAIYCGILVGIVISYIFMLKYINYLNSQLIQNLNDKIKKEEKQLALVAIKRHNPSLEKYLLTCLTTTLSITGIISIYNYIQIFNPIIESILSFPGGIVGFLTGILLYKLFSWVCVDPSSSQLLASTHDSCVDPSSSSLLASTHYSYKSFSFCEEKYVKASATPLSIESSENLIPSTPILLSCNPVSLLGKKLTNDRSVRTIDLDPVSYEASDAAPTTSIIVEKN